MKHQLLGITALAAVLTLGACGGGNNDAMDDAAGGDNDDQAPTTEETGDATETAIEDDKAGENPSGGKNDGMEETTQGYGFKDFDLEIDVDGKDAVDASYETKEDGTFEAEYKNTLEGVDYGDDNQQEEAMNELDALFKEILLDQNVTEEKAKTKILDALEIQDYTKFELEVNFDEGPNLNIEENK
ncbi:MULTISPECIES: YusW family protein [Bhargavaea]|uniref:YusW family protein n=1 Tax=Bhargavaea changchunensis TaxID=2134037 RepID=A0ABW2NFQ7_9BACL|nr:YusW family protein [Bhargavaea sp. CC-171006]